MPTRWMLAILTLMALAALAADEPVALNLPPGQATLQLLVVRVPTREVARLVGGGPARLPPPMYADGTLAVLIELAERGRIGASSSAFVEIAEGGSAHITGPSDGVDVCVGLGAIGAWGNDIALTVTASRDDQTRCVSNVNLSSYHTAVLLTLPDGKALRISPTPDGRHIAPGAPEPMSLVVIATPFAVSRKQPSGLLW